MRAPVEAEVDLAIAMNGAIETLLAENPKAAQGLGQARDDWLKSFPPLSVARTAEMLELSRPTIYDWLARGVLKPARGASGTPQRVDARSLMTILPVIREWHAAGTTKRALGAILDRLDLERDRELMRNVAANRSTSDEGYEILDGGFGNLGPTLKEKRAAAKASEATSTARPRSSSPSGPQRRVTKPRSKVAAASASRAQRRPAKKRVPV